MLKYQNRHSNDFRKHVKEETLLEETASKRKTKKAIREVTFENKYIKLTVVPEMGGKITELLNKQSGTQFIRPGNVPLDDIDLPKYAEAFLPPYAYGFDECFPSIGADIYESNGTTRNIPDHGELWTQAWRADIQPDKLVLDISGKAMKYNFRKEISLHKNQVEFKYRLQNTGDEAFDYLWSAHPLLSVEAGDEVLLPQKTRKVRIHAATDERLEDGETANWPELIPGSSSFDVVKEKSSGFASKLFVENPQSGKAALYRKRFDESLLIEFDTESVPHLGLWLCYGGWPDDDNYTADYSIAFEPTTASTDVLSEARQLSQSVYIQPKEVKEWKVAFSLINAKPVDF
ncbi:DUF5107 domain-containing protein [Gracilimonas mengyeensis]|uniref:Galactose mutarotase n=1 Tax=Gracilimonas mengyeensis TaxID=1302730 RepID=A0A521BSB9_9BACT|nr:DUF5107 domain-containing protein [Gracilimonas mengyeensis]SMO50044.1 Galactose mutarotase [Gracilimonas mengyeensis]